MFFRDVCGHERQIAQLRGYLVRERVPHAFLFYGMEGIGKRTASLLFAKALNCLTERDDCCDTCVSCRKADHRNHPDIVIIEPEGQFIKIQAIRGLQERMKFKPWEGKKRVSIIDDADRMNEPAANALLKTLEEPPAGPVIILVSANPSQLPATILSRCQHLRFNPLPEERISFFLEQRGCPNASARLLASFSGGSIARALTMQDGAYLDRRKEIMDLAVGAMGDPLERLSRIGSFGQRREEVMERLGIFRTCYRDAMVYKELGAAANLINHDRMDMVENLTTSLSVRDMISDIKAIDHALAAIEQHGDKSLTLEVMMFRLK